MRTKHIILIIAAAVSCTLWLPGIPLPPEYAATVEVDPEISPIVQKFYKEAAEARPIRALYLPVRFVVSYENDDIGRCYQLGPFKLIHISKEYWYATDEVEHEALVYHELGHCVLGKKHEGQGLMRPWAIEKEDYVKNREKYLRELFALEIKVFDE